MSDSIEPDHSASAAHSPGDFEKELLALCGVLEQWRAEQKVIEKAKLNEFLPLNWRAALYSACFFALFRLTAAAVKFFKIPDHNLGASLPVLTLLLFFLGCALLFAVRAAGFGTGQFWRTIFEELKNKDNYPFAPLLNGLRVDFSATDRLRPFSTHTLVAAQERISLEEATLGDQITSIVGSPNILAVLGLFGVIWAAWKDLSGQMNPLTWIIFAGTIIALILAAYGAHLRLSLFELTRCRALLSLEIARRNAAVPH
ncbi:MAG TPA: hypothetical protein VK717_11315 [Opitutaceae bacterium]|jgi:hypothetical protein|nr:hypothetical protein [Opitutaceae bacterium]